MVISGCVPIAVRSPEDGKLFRLECDPSLRAVKKRAADYYWLCGDCASTMTLHLGDHGDVVAVVLLCSAA
jgi:hypothetical protein